MANQKASPYPSTRLVDILRLIGGLAVAFLRNPFSPNPSLALSNWINGLMRRRQSDNLVVDLLYYTVDPRLRPQEDPVI